jgi:hypothetical protein
MTSKQLTDAQLDQRLRRTLRAVAATVDGEPTAAPKRRRIPRGIMVGLGASAIAVPLAAGAFYGVGSEYVDQIPPKDPIVAGSIDGNRYWVVESFHSDDCDKPYPGVELISEESNILGREWNTIGVSYGEERRCGVDVSEALADAALWDGGGTFVGDGFVWIVGVHPDVTSVRSTIDGSIQRVAVHPVDGAGYAVIELPEDTTQFSVELLIDGEVVPGSKQTRDMFTPVP